MTPEQIRNQCEDDADHTPSALTVWRDRGVIIAAQQTRIAQLESALRESLSSFAHPTHPGLACRQSGHVPVETLARWNEALS